MLGVYVGNGVLDGVNVKAGGNVLAGGGTTRVMFADGGFVDVNTIVGMSVLATATLEGVALSAANPVGTDDPMIGIETKNVRALEDTISRGSIGTIGTIGS